ncbi:MAG TPA: tetratricopeptide repeat protein [Stellaceae bacterium]|nr:tetratricopeptide repeat protein [Stellaceae bacterium]
MSRPAERSGRRRAGPVRLRGRPQASRTPEPDLAELRKLADEAGPEAALPRVLALVERNSGAAQPRLLAAELLSRLGRHDEAEGLLRAGLDAAPDNRELAAAYARSAQDRGDRASALDRWLAYRERFPEDPLGHDTAGGLLLDLGRLDDAEKILAAGALLPEPGREMLRNYARVAQLRDDWPEALRRWNAFRQQFPEDTGGYSGAAVARHQVALGEIREADALLEQGLELFPQNGDIIGTYARLAHTRRAWLEALDRWQLCRRRLPDDPVGYAGLGEVLRTLGRFDEAEAVLSEGARRIPGNQGILSAQARVAFDRRDWQAALERWTAHLQLFPDDSIAQAQLQLVLGELNRFHEATALPLGRQQPSAADGDLPPAQLMLKFESLGQDCEFGIVQRHFGAEPLGLLRFTLTPIELLAEALGDRLAGIGETDNTEIGIRNGEYVTGDKRYQMRMHTFIRADEGDPQRRLDGFCRRLRFLRDKLLDDLAEGRKIFVYAWGQTTSDDSVRGLYRALCGFGRNRLLFVQPAEPGNQAGALRRLDDGLMLGYVDRLSTENPSFPVWLELCRQAHQQMAPVGS